MKILDFLSKNSKILNLKILLYKINIFNNKRLKLRRFKGYSDINKSIHYFKDDFKNNILFISSSQNIYEFIYKYNTILYQFRYFINDYNFNNSKLNLFNNLEIIFETSSYYLL